MKKYFLYLVVSIVVLSCDNAGFNNRNPYINNYSFRVQVDTNLPAYNQLSFAGNGIRYYGSGLSENGIIIFNTGNNSYVAYDGACPNQALSTCSSLNLSGINAVCSCDNAKYNLFTGLAPNREYPLKAYRVEVSGTIVSVYN